MEYRWCGDDINQKKANTACGSDLYINKEKLHGHFENPYTACKEIFASKVWNKKMHI
jgi:hypothetical protein